MLQLPRRNYALLCTPALFMSMSSLTFLIFINRPEEPIQMQRVIELPHLSAHTGHSRNICEIVLIIGDICLEDGILMSIMNTRQ